MPTEKAKRGRKQQPSVRSANTTSSTDAGGGAGEAKRAACAYLDRGWSVVPVRSRSKAPLVPWRAYQHERPARRDIESWFEQWPDANIGIVTGQISNLVVLDIDPRHGGDESLANLTRQFDTLPPTLTVRTGGDGRHLYFAAPADPVPIRSRVGLARGVDVRAEGGMVVAPPSIHPSGQRYAWIAGKESDGDLAPLPRWVVRLIRGDTQYPGHSLRYWRELAAEGVLQGERNSAIASFAGHLLWCGVNVAVIKELLLCWNRVRARPPLDDEEVVRTVESILRTHHGHRPDHPGPG